MSVRRFDVAFALLVAVLFLSSSPREEYPRLSKYWVSSANPELKTIARDFDIVARRDGGFHVLVPLSRTGELVRAAPEARLLERDIDAHARWESGYHDFTSVQTHLRKIAADHPTLAKLETYGKSKEGRPLFALKLSDNVEKDEDEPEAMLTSATHGNELISVEVVLGLLDQLVGGYGKDPRLTALVDGREIYFIPVVNPDGYTRKSRYANGVDPNREYPGPSEPERTPNECIAEIMKFFHAHEIKGSLDFHSHGGLIMYPWAYTEELPKAHEHFEGLTKKMAETSGYEAGQISQLIFPVAGSSADYYHWKNGSTALGVEIGEEHVPPKEDIKTHVDANTESTWLFLEALQ